MYLKLLFYTLFKGDANILSIPQSITEWLFYCNFPFQKIKLEETRQNPKVLLKAKP